MPRRGSAQNATLVCQGCLFVGAKICAFFLTRKSRANGLPGGVRSSETGYIWENVQGSQEVDA